MKTKNNIYVFLIAVCLSLLSIPASAATADGSIVGAVQAALEAAAKSQILPQAILWLGSFMGLQMLLTNIGLLKSGADIETIFAKLLGSILWFTFVVYVMNNGADFIDSVGTSVINKFMPTWLSPGYILAIVTTIAGALITGIGLSGIMVLGSGSPMLALVLTVIMFVIVGVGLYVSIKIFMLKLELGLILVLAPLSFSLLGLNALKDQGIAPFKALLSLVYRIILFGIVCTAFKEVGTVTSSALDAIDWGNIGGWVDAIKVVFSAMFAFPMLGYLVYKSDSIAASLAGGTTNMGPGDVASAAAAGAAAGAMVASGGAAAMGAATKPAQLMSDVMSQMRGGGSVSNASSQGMGGATNSLPLSPSPVASMGSEGGKPSPDSPAPTESSKPTPDQLSKLSPQAQNCFGVSAAAEAAGANQKVSKAAGDTAYMGGSPQEIEAAVAQAGGTQAQGQAAGAASTGVGGPDWNKAAKPVEASPSSGSTAGGGGGGLALAPGVVLPRPGQSVGDVFYEGLADGGSLPGAGADTSLQSPPTDSGSSAGVGGAGSATDQKAAQQGGGKTGKAFLDHLSNVNQLISQEKVATHVSINTHHSD